MTIPWVNVSVSSPFGGLGCSLRRYCSLAPFWYLNRASPAKPFLGIHERETAGVCLPYLGCLQRITLYKAWHPTLSLQRPCEVDGITPCFAEEETGSGGEGTTQVSPANEGQGLKPRSSDSNPVIHPQQHTYLKPASS